MTDRAPRPEGMSDESDWRHWPAESQLARIADGAMPGPDDEIGGCITRQQAQALVGELSRLRADGATLRERVESEPFGSWHEDDGAVLWWRFPVAEPPYVGSPLHNDWPFGEGDKPNLWWTRLLVPSAPKEPTPHGKESM